MNMCLDWQHGLLNPRDASESWHVKGERAEGA